MATIKFLIKGTKDKTPIFLRLYSGKLDLQQKTGFVINRSDWSKKTNKLKQITSKNKQITIDLKSLDTKITDELNTAMANGIIINREWLSYQIDLHFNRVSKKGEYSNILLDHINKIINDGNSLKELDTEVKLSYNRLKAYRSLKNKITNYQTELGTTIIIKNVNRQFVRDFRTHLNTKDYKTETIDKYIMDLKTVCKNAIHYDIEVSNQIHSITINQKKNKYIIYLKPNEIKLIENKTFKTDRLTNIKKWLLLGVNIGQRGSDLLNINENNIENKYGMEMIVLTQQKTDKQVEIPLTPQIKEIIKDGFPYKISIQKLNIGLKEVCQIAKINTPTKGWKKVKETKKDKTVIFRDKLDTYEKWQLITSHCLRRTFASNNYSKLPTPLIMSITGHSSEKTLMTYIGETKNVFAKQIFEYFTQQSELQKKETNLKVVPNETKTA